MIKALMGLALRERIIVIGVALALLGAGLFSFSQLDIEAYPDPIQPMVEVLTLPTGLSAEEVEKMVTVPLEYGLASSRNLVRMDSISLFGLSDIRCYFTWDSDYYWDRVEVINRLGFVTLPQGITAGISPENPIGEIYRYVVESPDHNLLREKTIDDWVVAKQLTTVPGIIGVSTFGGLTKQYHVDVDPQKLTFYKIPLPTLVSAIQNSNTDAGGNYLNLGEQAFDVRGLGFIHSLNDIRNIVLGVHEATPITVGNVANVSIGYAPRLGIVGMNDHDEVVTGIVLMRKYGNTLETLKGVEKKVAWLNSSGVMPKGYKVVPYYDRTALVRTTLRTVYENLSVGIVLVFLVLIFFLGSFRAGLIAAVNIPLALCGAFTLMWLGKTPANLISLGAIDFGIIIDSTVIVMENIHRHMAMSSTPQREGARARILRAAEEVGGPIFYSTLIFVIAFLPLFTMRGVEGAIFSPMSHTYAYALGTAILLAATLSPVLASFAFAHGIKHKKERLWGVISSFYHGVFERILRWPKITLAAVVAIAFAVFSLYPKLGGEFLPKLEEGNIWAHAIMPSTMSLDQGARIVNQIRRVFMSFPEVTTVVSQLGRPDDGTETTGFFNCELYVDLKPQSEWPAGLTKPKLIGEINAKLTREFPGVNFSYSQNIEDNVNEALSGVKAGANAIKVFGRDLDTDQSVAAHVAAVLKTVPGITNVFAYQSLNQPNVLIRPDRTKCARYGINVGDVTTVVQAAIGGDAVTQVIQGDRRFDLVVRWKKHYRTSLDGIRNIRVTAPDGSEIPLAQLADIRLKEGASFIYRESLQRYVPLTFSVRGRDLEDAVRDAKARVARQVNLPRGTYLEWVGEYGELKQANERLMVIVPVALLLIAGVLYGATTSLIDTFVIMAQIPVACVGGILGLYVTGTPFSVSAAVGFISIFGIATMDGILLSFYIRQLWEEGHPFTEAIVMGSDRRLRATMMTDLVDALGLLPMALSTRIGAQTQRPLAIVVIGGALAIMILTRVLQPVLIYLCHRRLRRADAEGMMPAST
jgi:cobalt-zinc-cadmium resistance protein CzcA